MEYDLLIIGEQTLENLEPIAEQGAEAAAEVAAERAVDWILNQSSQFS